MNIKVAAFTVSEKSSNTARFSQDMFHVHRANTHTEHLYLFDCKATIPPGLLMSPAFISKTIFQNYMPMWQFLQHFILYYTNHYTINLLLFERSLMTRFLEVDKKFHLHKSLVEWCHSQI